MTWWETNQWLAYEAVCGVAVPRARELAESTWQTRIVNLQPSAAELWRGVRRSYRSLIHGAQRAYHFSVCGCGLTDNANEVLGAAGLIKTCQRVHFLDSGRRTRPDASWDMMGNWVCNGNGLIVMALDWDDQPTAMKNWPPCIGFTYVIVHDAWAYYASAATLRPNVNHGLVWRAMQELKVLGVRWFEIGWQGHAQDDKGRNIEMFRRGFGGIDMPAREAPLLCRGSHEV